MLRCRFPVVSSWLRLSCDPSIHTVVNSGTSLNINLALPLRFLRTVKTFVWWDLRCLVPQDDLCAVFNRMGSALESRGMESPTWVNAYADFSKVSNPVQEALVSSGIHLFHVPQCETTSSLLQRDIMTWLTYNTPPAHVILVTNDATFASTMQYLTRLKYVVIISCDAARKRKLLCKASTFMWPWQPLAKGLAFDSVQFNEIPDTVHQVRDANRVALDHRKVLGKYSFEPKPGAKARVVYKLGKSNISCPKEKTGNDVMEADDETETEPLKFDGKIIYCKTSQEVESAILELNEKLIRSGVQQVPLGFDTEWKPHGRGESLNKTAVIQIQAGEEFDRCCYVLHIMHSGIPSVLKSLLENKAYLKVGVDISTDAKKLAEGYNVQVQPIIDIDQLAATKFLRPAKIWGLSSLTAIVLEKKLEKPKEIAKSNWESDVLTEEQILYAATDAYASLYVYQVIALHCTIVRTI